MNLKLPQDAADSETSSDRDLEDTTESRQASAILRNANQAADGRGHRSLLWLAAP